jgi:chemotaxis protein MotB
MAEYNQPYIIKKIKKAAHVHHGGAWKIAYADFVTAMMAFFLLLWLMSMTTPEQKKGIADYFAPPNVSESTSGAGGILGGLAYDQDQAKMNGSPTDAKQFTAPDSQPKSGPMVAVTGGRGAQSQKADEQKKAEDSSDLFKTSKINISSSYNQDFQSAAASIRQAWQAMPDVSAVQNNLVVEETEDGLNIKILDRQGQPMFAEGSKYPFEITREAIAAIAPILQRLPNEIRIAGYTASGATYRDPHYGPWELSMDRANVVRGILGEFGLANDHIDSVVGRADNDPLLPDDPYLASNGRIEITLLYKAPPVPPNMSP